MQPLLSCHTRCTPLPGRVDPRGSATDGISGGTALRRRSGLGRQMVRTGGYQVRTIPMSGSGAGGGRAVRGGEPRRRTESAQPPVQRCQLCLDRLGGFSRSGHRLGVADSPVEAKLTPLYRWLRRLRPSTRLTAPDRPAATGA
jgi:hypothetical protein